MKGDECQLDHYRIPTPLNEKFFNLLRKKPVNPPQINYFIKKIENSTDLSCVPLILPLLGWI